MKQMKSTGVVKNGKLFAFGNWYEIEHVKGHVVKTCFEGQTVQVEAYAKDPKACWVYFNEIFEVWQRCK